jgi:hypothetical protein
MMPMRCVAMVVGSEWTWMFGLAVVRDKLNFSVRADGYKKKGACRRRP